MLISATTRADRLPGLLGLPPAPSATPGVGAGVEPGASLYRRRAPAAASSPSPARALPTPETT
jgi:hypothetical protein